MTARFRRLYEDTPGGKYVRRLSPTRFQYLEWTDMDDACGRDNEGHPRYVVELSEVDVADTPLVEINSALDSCGWEGMADGPDAIAECLHSYGCKAPLGSWSGSNLRKLMRSGRAEAAALDCPVAHERAMCRPVNAIGSTAREYAQGDIYSAMYRGVAEGNPNAKLVAKIYGLPVDGNGGES